MALLRESVRRVINLKKGFVGFDVRFLPHSHIENIGFWLRGGQVSPQRHQDRLKGYFATGYVVIGKSLFVRSFLRLDDKTTTNTKRHQGCRLNFATDAQDIVSHRLRYFGCLRLSHRCTDSVLIYKYFVIEE